MHKFLYPSVILVLNFHLQYANSFILLSTYSTQIPLPLCNTSTPATPAGTWTCSLLITSLTLYYWAIPASSLIIWALWSCPWKQKLNFPSHDSTITASLVAKDSTVMKMSSWLWTFTVILTVNMSIQYFQWRLCLTMIYYQTKFICFKKRKKKSSESIVEMFSLWPWLIVTHVFQKHSSLW